MNLRAIGIFLLSNDSSQNQKFWKVLTVDDEDGTRHATELALSGLVFADRECLFVNAFSSSEAIVLLKNHDDIAFLLLDVCMESDDVIKIVDAVITLGNRLKIRVLIGGIKVRNRR